MIVKKYPTDALYPSSYDWVSCLYLMEKVSKGMWINICGDQCFTQIVSPESMSFAEYKKAHILISGEPRGLETRYKAMTECPLLKTMYGLCDLPNY